ncbi:hypothetical protein K2173_004437 [Erythroxylum novogranatense]|uniref:Late embryogenesis abundant protein LEA-2 subgroup domain-containing protein n=1 Tax=Erythroxylum novogranatense TaxID=1862640 RepID=A0AAV8T4H9_9ROSI|nr:hypothetical protein K2173_004437 [Erythroxylum novogranatense]
MSSSDHLPTHYGPAENRNLKRHHTARYYGRRVKESLTTRVSKVICAIFLSGLFVLGAVAFILWLSLRPHRPRFFIENFSVPGLGQSNGFENVEIGFNVTARNSNQHIVFYYDSMTASVYYKDQQIGSSGVEGEFYQEPKNTTVISKVLSGATLTVNSQRWSEFTNDRDRGMVMFRLEITSIIRFKVFTWWESHSHHMHANCDATVGPDGMILATFKRKRCPLYFS